jgi:hypothetical protein
MPPDSLPGADACAPLVLRALPPAPRRLLLAGCPGPLGAALRRLVPATRIDAADDLNGPPGAPAFEPGSLDCIVYGAGLSRLWDPTALLRRQRPLLAPGGFALWAVPNAQHFSRLLALLRGEPAEDAAGALGWPAARVLQDGGFAPALLDAVPAPCPPDLLAALGPLLQREGLHPAQAQRQLSAAWYVLKGSPLPDEGTAEVPAPPLTFVACASDEAALGANLLRSPCLQPGSPHELLLYRVCPSAADGLNRGLAQAKHARVVCLHQDVYLPAGWPRRFQAQYAAAERTLGPLGVAGVYGVTCRGDAVDRAGHVVDRDRLLREPPPLPCAVDTLDELLLALPRGTPLRFDPRLGFHLYGADACLQARQRGLPVVALDALCFHNSKSVGLPPAFEASARLFAQKWRASLPLATSCVHIDAAGRMRLA